MASKIVFSHRAEKERLAILEYYFNETQSNKIPYKIYIQISEILDIISEFPKSGRILNQKGHRGFSKLPYLIIYKITNEAIEILHVWDSRRNPQELKL